MHDIKFIRANPEAFDKGLARRGLAPQSAELLKLDEQKRKDQTQLQELQSKRNALAKQIGQAKSKGEDVSAIMDEAKKNNDMIAVLEANVSGRGALEAALEIIPNIPADDVPEGKDEHGNKEVRVVGSKPALTINKPKLHDELGTALKLMDFDSAAKLSGARFVVLKGALARMERALANFMLDIHTNEFGYTEHVPPFLVRDNAVYGTGQLPKFAEDLFLAGSLAEDGMKTEVITKPTGEIKRVQVKNHFWLVPTAEVPLTNLVADSILDEDELKANPIRMTAYTPCFRSEAGAAGKDTRGMIRQHQFSKVELVSITHPDQSKAEHERMTSCAEEILKRLGLHYRTMLLCTGDMGFCSQKTYDLEVWMPGQNAFREISSCSNCGDFQARRMKARFKGKNSKETQFVHTLNGSGLAIGRTMVAIIENYQQADGSIIIPDKLKPYMGGVEKIAA
jgi:seryl-tRNA synthetase